MAQGTAAPATSMRPLGFLGHSRPSKAFPGRLQMRPAQVSVAAQSLAVPPLDSGTES